MKKKYYLPVETHSHTNHSGGDFTASELVEEAFEDGYKGLIITDHNTYLAYDDITSDLLEKYPLAILEGVELATENGHLLVWGDWVDIEQAESANFSADKFLEALKKQNTLICVAHPYEKGSSWDFEALNNKYINAIEIWNELNPQDKTDSTKAYDKWLELLNSGQKINCHCGRDWYRTESKTTNHGAVYLELETDSVDSNSFSKALSKGQYYISLGPVLNWELGDVFLGDEVRSDKISGQKFKFTIQGSKVKSLSLFPTSDLVFKLYNNDNLIALLPGLAFTEEYEITLPDQIEEGYLRFELESVFRGENHKVIIGNPIYIN